jgi:ABC-2 type transport system ATP-binding protein
MIEARELCKQYGVARAVDRVSFRVGRGEVVGYLGPNGAGKSTTVRMLVGMTRPNSGTALVAGMDAWREPLAVKRRIGYVPESAALYETLTGREHLELCGRLYHLEDGALGARASELGASLGLGDVLDARIATYSKGMRRKLVLAAALLHDPDVLFLDEPLDGLDVAAQALTKTLVRRLADGGKTIFYCSHILEVVERVCDRVIILDHGRVIADGAVGDVRAQAASLEEVFRRLTGGLDVDAAADRLTRALKQEGP